MTRDDLYKELNYFKSCSDLFKSNVKLNAEQFQTILLEKIEYIDKIDVPSFRKVFISLMGNLKFSINSKGEYCCNNDTVKNLLMDSMVLINGGDLVVNDLLTPIVRCCGMTIEAYLYLSHTYRFLHGFEKGSFNAVDSFYWVLNNEGSNLSITYKQYLKGVVNKAIRNGSDNLIIALFNITRFCQIDELREDLIMSMSLKAVSSDSIKSILKEYYSFYEE